MKTQIVFDNIRSADFKAALMAEMGLSDQYISDKTGLSPGQIHYRTKQCGIRRRDYRNGSNYLSQVILGKIGRLIGRKGMSEKGCTFALLREKSLQQGRKTT